MNTSSPVAHALRLTRRLVYMYICAGVFICMWVQVYVCGMCVHCVRACIVCVRMPVHVFVRARVCVTVSARVHVGGKGSVSNAHVMFLHRARRTCFVTAFKNKICPSLQGNRRSRFKRFENSLQTQRNNRRLGLINPCRIKRCPSTSAGQPN